MLTHAATRSSTSVRAILCASGGAPNADSTTTGPVTSHRRQSSLEIRDEILRVLYPDADAHQAVADAQGVTLGLRVPGVGHGRGMRYQGLDAAQALTQRAQLHRPQQPVRGLARAEIEGDQGPEAAGLPPVHVVAGVIGEPRPVDLAHFLLLAQ